MVQGKLFAMRSILDTLWYGIVVVEGKRQFLKINKRGGSNKCGGHFLAFSVYIKLTYFEVIVTQTNLYLW